MRKRGLCCGPVSVCLSVTFVHSIQMAEDIKLLILSRPHSPTILVFFGSRRRYPIPRGTPLAGAQNTRGWENFCDFRLKSPSISETVRDRPMDGCYWTLIGSLNSEQRKHVSVNTFWVTANALYRMVTFSMTLTDPKPVFKVTAFLKSNISKTS